MHILAAIFGILAALAVWYFRTHSAVRGAEAVGDAIGHAKGAVKRRNFRKKTEGSTLGTVDDPRVAAAVLLVALGFQNGELSEKKEFLIAAMLSDRTGLQGVALEEAMSFSKWVNREIADGNDVVRRFIPLWKAALTQQEQSDLIAMAHAVIEFDGEPGPAQNSMMRRLTDGLSL